MNYKYPFCTSDIFEIRDNFPDFEKIKSKCYYSSTVECSEVSVLIPLYSNISYFFETLKSVVNQQDAPLYEIVISDNNPDKPNELVIDYLKKNKIQGCAYYWTNEIQGMVANWNRCIQLAHSPFVVYVHSDDMLYPDALNKLWSAHLKLPQNAAILARRDIINSDSEVVSRSDILYYRKRVFPFKKIYKNNIFSFLCLDYDNGCGELLSKSVLYSLGGWNPRLYPAFDFALMALYQKKCVLYRLNDITKLTRIAHNESFIVASSYRACNYYMVDFFIRYFFKDLKILHYWNKKVSNSADFSVFGIKDKKEVNIFDRLIIDLPKKIYSFFTMRKIL